MNRLKNILLLAVAAALFAGSYFILAKGPCDSPLTYRIGSFDAKFGVSKAEFLKDAARAESIWEKAAGRELFKYDPSGDLPLNLVYDARQATADKNKVLEASVDKTVQTADQVKAELDAARAGYEAAHAEYLSLASRYDAHPTEPLRLEVNAKAAESNDLARRVNGLVDAYNSLVRSANANVRTINQSADREFEQGEYVRDAKGERINVYEFDGEDRLVRLLAHEFGHALGMDHVPDPEAIMYYLNSGKGMAATKDDVAALRAACKLGV